MKETRQTSKSSAANILVVGICCLAAGVGLGYYFGSSSASQAVPEAVRPQAQSQVPAMDEATFRKTESELKSMLASNPRDVGHMVQLGNLYYDNGKFAEAIDAYGKALEIDPKNVAARTDRGSCYWSLGKPDAAIGEFQKSLEVDPTHAQTLYNLGIVSLHGKNDVAGAQQAWSKLVEYHPDYPDASRIRQMLSSLGAAPTGQGAASGSQNSGRQGTANSTSVEDLFRKMKK
jgi:cytochrome c-type biogenesis protein CcmH/NrfG